MAEPAAANQTAGKGLLIAGYIFAFLGGLIGSAIGAHIKLAKVSDGSGNKVAKYDEASRKQGLIIFVISFVSMIFWKSVSMATR